MGVAPSGSLSSPCTVVVVDANKANGGSARYAERTYPRCSCLRRLPVCRGCIMRSRSGSNGRICSSWLCAMLRCGPERLCRCSGRDCWSRRRSGRGLIQRGVASTHGRGRVGGCCRPHDATAENDGSENDVVSFVLSFDDGYVAASRGAPK